MYDSTIRDAAGSTSDDAAPPPAEHGDTQVIQFDEESLENEQPRATSPSVSPPVPAQLPRLGSAVASLECSPTMTAIGNSDRSISKGSISDRVIPEGAISDRVIPEGAIRESDRVSGKSPFPGGDGLARLVWLMAMLAFMVGVRYAVPRFAEDIQYSITRGRERAQYEQAGYELRDTPLAGLSRAYQLVSKRVSPSVVHINVANTTTRVSDDGLGFLFSGPRHRESAGQGSGVIVDESGYIVTNYHVVEGATEIEVGLSDGRRVGAQIVGLDAATDLAVLRIDADKLVPAEWGDSEKIEVGSLVWAAGSPFGLQRTITFGILSAKNRAGLKGTTYHDFLQTDAAVNPGNSGGPLVDEEGRIIGINTAIVGEVYQGISFAIPSNIVREVYDRLRREGRVARGWLGVEMAEVTEELAHQLGLNVPRGVYVVQLVDALGSSPARQAGVQQGDVIIRWNEDEIISPTTLQRLVGKTQIGSEARVLVVRSGSQLELNVAVGERPSRP